MEYVHCGFVRSYILSATTGKFGQLNSSYVYEWLLEKIPSDLRIKLPEKDKKAKVKIKLKKFVQGIRDCKLKAEYRERLCNAFSVEIWNKLTDEEQSSHTFSDCKVSVWPELIDMSGGGLFKWDPRG